MRNINFIFILSFSSISYAGLLVIPSISWNNSAFVSTKKENTPNIYGYGAAMNLGYSFNTLFDLSGYGKFIPANFNKTKFKNSPTIEQYFYGGEIGIRILSYLYLGIQAGLSRLQIFATEESKALVQDHYGKWAGNSYGITLGAFKNLNKEKLFQVDLKIIRAPLTKQDGSLKQNLDSFQLSFSYVFIGKNNSIITNKIFKNFLDTLF